jgi:hypothetical protein
MRKLCGLALVLALAGAGCGDDDDDGGAATPERLASSTSEQAAAICARTIPKATQVLGAKSISDFERYGREAGAVVQTMRDDLEPLDPGEGASAQWRSWLDAIDADLAAYRKLELAGSVANREVVLEQFGIVQEATPAHVARELHLPACAEATNRAAKTFD